MPTSGQSLGQENLTQTFPRRPKIELCRVLGAFWERLGRLLVQFGGILSALGGIWEILESSWRHLGWNFGHLGDVLGPSWGVLGDSWVVRRRSWRLPETILASFFKGFRVSYAIYENSKKPRKTNGFSMIFEVLGEFWESKIRKNRQKLVQRT